VDCASVDIEEVILKQTASNPYETQPKNRHAFLPNMKTGEKIQETSKKRYYRTHN